MILRRRPSKTVLLLVLMALVVLQVAVTSRLGIASGINLAGALAALAIVAIAHVYFTVGAKLDEHGQKQVEQHAQDTRQIQALLYLFSAIRPRRPLPPMRNMAISPDFAATLVAHVLESKPLTILEFGSGTSTVLCGYCLEMLGEGTVISIDHEKKYADETRTLLREHSLDRFARVVTSPLKNVSLPAGRWQWYETSFIQELPPIDLLIVDGPPAQLQPMSRYPALPLIASKLSASATILVDDAGRQDERDMVRRWMSEFPGFYLTELAHEKGTVLLKRVADPTQVRSQQGQG
jgi:predicted O-methyltransferase YrrM